MKFELFSEVILNVDVTEDGLKQGDVGTVVEHHETPSGEKRHYLK